MERTARLAPDVAEVHYDLALILLANENSVGALNALRSAIKLNPKLKSTAMIDGDLNKLRGDAEFIELVAK